MHVLILVYSFFSSFYSLRGEYPAACCVTKGEDDANTPLLQQLQEANVQWTFECLYRENLFHIWSLMRIIGEKL